MITEFGKFLRILRINNGEILRDMANFLEVSPAYLSAVEVGKKNAPEKWIDKISSKYNLPENEKHRLACLRNDSVRSVKIDLLGTEQQKRNAAIVFARNFESLSEDTAAKILNLVNKDRGE